MSAEDRKAIPLRLVPQVDAKLRAVAEVEGKSINATAEELIDQQIEALRNDKGFQARLKRALERNREALELLSR
jgi:hypothetical protein